MAGTFIWPLAIRIGHWSLVTTTVVAWLTRHASGPWHEWLGYAVLVIVAWRTLTGVFGPAPHAFASFVASPSRTIAYLWQLRSSAAGSGAVAIHAGHNPLGAWMVLLLLTLLVVTGFTGWLYTTDRYWGVEWVGTAHAWCSDALVAAVVLHVGGVLFASWHEKRNLVAAMVHGRKPL